MNRERCRELLPIIQAFAEGKTIQAGQFTIGENGESLNSRESDWTDCDDPEWYELTEYRIKPEPMEIWVVFHPDGDREIREYKKGTGIFIDANAKAKHFREVIE